MQNGNGTQNGHTFASLFNTLISICITNEEMPEMEKKTVTIDEERKYDKIRCFKLDKMCLHVSNIILYCSKKKPLMIGWNSSQQVVK